MKLSWSRDCLGITTKMVVNHFIKNKAALPFDFAQGPEALERAQDGFLPETIKVVFSKHSLALIDSFFYSSV